MTNNKELTVSEASELTGYSERHIRRLAKQGRIEARQAGGWLYLIQRESLLEYAHQMQALGTGKHSPKE